MESKQFIYMQNPLDTTWGSMLSTFFYGLWAMTRLFSVVAVIRNN